MSKLGEYKPDYQKDNYKYYYTNGQGLIPFSEMELICKELPDVIVGMHDSGMVATHNMPCPICKVKHAVFESSQGVFSPCWECQEEGYKIINIKHKNWLHKVADWLEDL